MSKADFPSSLLLRSPVSLFSFLFFLPSFLLGSSSFPLSVFHGQLLLALALCLPGCVSGLVPPTLSCESTVIQAQAYHQISNPLYNITRALLLHGILDRERRYKPFLNSHTTTVPLEGIKTPAGTSRRSRNTTKGSSHSLSCQTTQLHQTLASTAPRILGLSCRSVLSTYTAPAASVRSFL